MRGALALFGAVALVAGGLYAWPSPKLSLGDTERQLPREVDGEAARCVKAPKPPREDETGVPISHIGPAADFVCRVRDEQGWTEDFPVYVDGDSIKGYGCLRC